ncbi:MAG TPA: hypothetical protein VFR23_04165 [Jiangellaceae bacterium]|nr:hypothetical protein [Jiangellaceae bacterium]
MTTYEEIAELVTGIRNARFGEMVNYSERLIESEAWQDFTTPVGTHFQFRRFEYDYFLAAMDADATTLRHAYVTKAPAAKLMRLADITGRGRPPVNGDRRDRTEVVRLYSTDPSGAGARIMAWAKEAVVTERTAIVAKNPQTRKAIAAGQSVRREKPNLKDWRVRWFDDRSPAQAIAERLLKDPELARQVYERLVTARKNGEIRRSVADSNGNRARP